MQAICSDLESILEQQKCILKKKKLQNLLKITKISVFLKHQRSIMCSHDLIGRPKRRLCAKVYSNTIVFFELPLVQKNSRKTYPNCRFFVVVFFAVRG